MLLLTIFEVRAEMLARLVGTHCAEQALPCRVQEHPQCPSSPWGLACASATMLPSDSSAAMAVLISVEAALGELLPGLGGHREVTGLA